VASAFPAGTVFSQSPAAGTTVNLGSQIEIQVALAPPPTWTPPERRVPDVRGMSSDGARLALLLAGYVPHKRHAIAPDAELGRVHAQAPPAGTPAPFGTVVDYFLPHASTVPLLVGKTKDEALALLAGASLDAVAILTGPQGPGATVVTWQQFAAGTQRPRQSAVKFRYKVLGPALKAVPNVVGLSKSVATQKIQAEGFVALLVLDGGFGIGTKVTNQLPAAGAMRPPGSVVKAHYVRTPLVVANQVPDVLGKTKAQAEAAITAAGFQATLVFTGGFGATTKVTHQDPAAGTLLAGGSVVTAHYVRVLGVAVKSVPAVVGLTRQAAKLKLEAEGFVVNLVEAPGAGTSTKVIAQNPAAGALRPVGSAVTVTWKKVLVFVPPLQVAVPNVKGKLAPTAKNLLEAAGFNVVFQGVGVKVKSQDPVGGTLVAPGTTVKLKLEF
jgi:serine/threonine-protein kinase